jgi:hypothetical protein
MRKLAYLLAGLLVIGGPYFFFRRPGDDTTSSSSPTRAPTHSTATIELIISHGNLAKGPSVIQVTQGETVSLRVTSDRADEVHLHGYDLYLALNPNDPAVLTFIASRSGRFTYELHGAAVELGALEVYPRE